MQALSRSARSLGLLLGLLTLFFVLLSYQVDQTRVLGAARGAVVTVTSPAQRLLSLATTGIGEVVSGWTALVGAAERAERLEGRVSDLERRVRQLRAAGGENRRLRELLHLRARSAGAGVPARVIGRDMAHRYEAATVDRGTMDGIVSDSPVLAPNGALVGRVVEPGPWTSVVQLLTGPLSGVGARLQESRATGLAAGAGGPTLELRYVDTETPVRAGEVVITSGEDGIYPGGIEVGTVAEFSAGTPVPGTPRIPLTREQTALFWDIRVEPGVQVTRLEHVLILPPPAITPAPGDGGGDTPQDDASATRPPAGEDERTEESDSRSVP